MFLKPDYRADDVYINETEDTIEPIPVENDTWCTARKEPFKRPTLPKVLQVTDRISTDLRAESTTPQPNFLSLTSHYPCEKSIPQCKS